MLGFRKQYIFKQILELTRKYYEERELLMNVDNLQSGKFLERKQDEIMLKIEQWISDSHAFWARHAIFFPTWGRRIA